MSDLSTQVNLLEEDAKIKEYSQKLYELRKDGVNKLLELKQEVALIRKNKMLEDDERKKQFEEHHKEIQLAKGIASKNKAEVKFIEKEAIAYANTVSKQYNRNVEKAQNNNIAEAKKVYKDSVSKIKSVAFSKQKTLNNKEDITVHKLEVKSTLFDQKNHLETSLGKCNELKRQAFVDHIQLNRDLRNGKSVASEDFSLKMKDYRYNFKTSKFLLDNGLYLAILIFFIVCIVVAPLQGQGNLLSLPNIFTILEQSSTRMFYAVGVAGLILLAGTDLSVGRMVALGSVVTGIILHPGMNIVTFFGMGPWDFSAIPMLVRVVMALSISVALCVAFSVFAGIFSAKLKIHPFISTLATQLIIYGLLFFGTSGTPVGSIDSGIKDMLGGRWILGVVNGELVTFPKLIIPAAIAIAVAWFIWNKTTFGKNMYAVGGNSEAASVSGISVTKVTMGVFIMAAVFYGFGSFFEAFRANASAGTGQGFELDAIAACVVGGISFSGGIGKIGGAVLGVIIFTGLTYCLTFLGIDTNLQFVFKGLIIIAAVALDSVKYLKKK